MAEVFYIAGVWDMFHVGHLHAIRNARIRAKDNILIVGVVTDEHCLEYKGFRPIIPYLERSKIIAALKYPDAVVPQFKQFDLKHMTQLKVNTVLLGANWKTQMPAHLKKMMEVVPVEFIPTTPRVTTTLIKEKIINENRNNNSGSV